MTAIKRFIQPIKGAFLLISASIICTLCYPQQTIPGNDFGYTKGNLTVSDAGAALYNIHIYVAPGAGGLQPDLNFIYNSQGGNGPMGLGWSLQGLSVISRTGRTWAQDGFNESKIAGFNATTLENSIKFNLLDRYTLDGERLSLAYDNIPQLPVNSTYGYPNTKYFPEQNNFSKVILIDTIHSSPTFFKVFSKDGLIKEYGHTSDSKILFSSNNKPIHWLLNSIEDRNGNFIHYKYFQDSLTGEYYPVKIEYSGNSKLNKDSRDSVVFVYEERNDTSITYFKGSKILSTKRLTSIVCYSREKTIRRYNFSYNYSVNSNKSLLTHLQEIGTNGTQIPETNFQYNDAFNNYQVNLNSENNIKTSLLLNSPADKLIETGDFNGDGLSDIMTYKPSTGETVFLINLSPNQSYQEIDNPINQSSITNGVVLLADLNADGKTDVFFYDSISGKNDFYLNDFQNNSLYLKREHINDSSFISEHVTGNCKIVFQDFTNDGLTDLFIYKDTGNFISLGGNILFVNQGNFNNGKTLHDNTLGVGNLNFAVQGYFIGMTGGPDYPNLPVSLRDSSELHLVDIDNNSYPDYLLYNKLNGRTALYYAYTTDTSENGYSYQAYTQNTTTPILDIIDPSEISGSDSAELQLVDLNSDGLPDIIYYDKADTALKCWLNKGNFEFEKSELRGIFLKEIVQKHQINEISFADQNFDGKVDLCLYDRHTGENIFFSNYGNMKFSNQWISLPTEIFDENKFALPGKFNVQSANDYLVMDPMTGSNKQFSSLLGYTQGYDKMIQINELGKVLEIDYATLLDTLVYKRNNYHTTYPNTEFQSSLEVVSQILTLDPVLGTVFQNQRHEYKYEDATLNLQGRGFRGFQKTSELDYASGVKTTKYYFRDTSNNIYVGDPIYKVETTVLGFDLSKPNGILASESNYVLGYNFYPKNYFGVSFFAYTKQNTSTNYEINGPIANVTQTRQEVDYYGNVTTMIMDYGGGYKDSTVNTYYNDTANWLLGRLTHATLYRAVPGKPMLVRNSSFEYDANTGQLIKEISFSNLDDKQKLTKVYHYDVLGNIIQSDVIGWNGKDYETRSTLSKYDSTGKFPIEVTNPLGQITSNEYDIYTGKVISTTDANGLKTQYSYDDLGRLKKQTFPDENWIYYDYKFYNINVTDKFPHDYKWVLVKQSSTEGNVLEFYDELDRKIGTQKVGFSGKEVIEEKEYYTNNLVGLQSRWHYYDESAQYARNGYDAFNRLNYQQRPGNIIDSTSFDVNTKTLYNSLGQKKTIITNAKVQPTLVIDNNGQKLIYDYDAAGNILSITDPKGNKIINQYDLKGDKVQMSDPDLGIYKYEYNAFNELIKQTYPSGNTIQFEYDKLGRLIKQTEKEGVTNWVYDQGNKGIGRLSNVTNYDTSGESYTYDNLGRLIKSAKKINGKTYNTNLTYNTQGRLDTLVYPSGFAIHHVYNDYGYLKEVRRVSNNFLYWRADKVNALGMTEIQEQGNNVFTQYYYNGETLFLDSLHGSNSSRFFNQWQFEFNSLGNLLQRTSGDNGKTEKFEYDDLNRLVRSYIVNGDTVNVKYDEIGNIIEKSDVGIYQYGDVNNGPRRVVQINQYNPQCIPSSQVKAEYTSFNKVNKLSNDSAVLEISYGFNKQRNLAKYYLRGQLTTTKIYASDLYEEEVSGGKTKEIHYIQAGDQIIASYIVANDTGRSYYWFKDHLGSLTTLTDTLGNVIEQLSYDAWGKRRNSNWTTLSDSITITDRGFTGHEHYDLFDLVDMNGRIYDPVIGRFTSADPFIQDISNLQDFNRYSYAGNNPLRYTDPSGYGWFDWVGDVIDWVSDAASDAWHFTTNAVAGGVSWVKDNWKTLVVATAAIVTSVVTGGTVATFWTTVLAGASGGFAGGFTGTLLNGGSVLDALGSGLKGALIGGVSAGLTYGVGEVASKLGTPGENISVEALGVKIAGNGLVQGGVERLNGGEFLHGFYAGAISGGFSGATKNINSKTFRLVGAAALGGVTSELSGGKFANGAVTAAYVMMFSDWIHSNEIKSANRSPASQTWLDKQLEARNKFLQEVNAAETPEMKRWDRWSDIGEGGGPGVGAFDILYNIGRVLDGNEAIWPEANPSPSPLPIEVPADQRIPFLD